MPEEINEQVNQPQGQPVPESQNQPGQEPQTEELDPFDRVLSELPEDKRKFVEEGFLRNKDYTQSKQRLSDERKRFAQERSENQTKIDFYNNFRDDANFRQEVLSSMGATKKVQKSDDFEEQYAKAQELINNLDPDSRKAMNFLIKKQIRDEVGPVKSRIEEFERQQTESRQRKLQQGNQERQAVLMKFKNEHPDYVNVEPEMEETIKGFPGFFNQSPKNLEKALRKVYQLANLPIIKKKSEEKGIKKMLDQNIQAQTVASKTVASPSPRKTFDNNGKKLKIDDAFDKAWDEMGG